MHRANALNATIQLIFNAIHVGVLFTMLFCVTLDSWDVVNKISCFAWTVTFIRCIVGNTVLIDMFNKLTM